MFRFTRRRPSLFACFTVTTGARQFQLLVWDREQRGHGYVGLCADGYGTMDDPTHDASQGQLEIYWDAIRATDGVDVAACAPACHFIEACRLLEHYEKINPYADESKSKVLFLAEMLSSNNRTQAAEKVEARWVRHSDRPAQST